MAHHVLVLCDLVCVCCHRKYIFPIVGSYSSFTWRSFDVIQGYTVVYKYSFSPRCTTAADIVMYSCTPFC